MNTPIEQYLRHLKNHIFAILDSKIRTDSSFPRNHILVSVKADCMSFVKPDSSVFTLTSDRDIMVTHLYYLVRNYFEMIQKNASTLSFRNQTSSVNAAGDYQVSISEFEVQSSSEAQQLIDGSYALSRLSTLADDVSQLHQLIQALKNAFTTHLVKAIRFESEENYNDQGGSSISIRVNMKMRDDLNETKLDYLLSCAGYCDIDEAEERISEIFNDEISYCTDYILENYQSEEIAYQNFIGLINLHPEVPQQYQNFYKVSSSEVLSHFEDPADGIDENSMKSRIIDEDLGIEV